MLKVMVSTWKVSVVRVKVFELMDGVVYVMTMATESKVIVAVPAAAGTIVKQGLPPAVQDNLTVWLVPSRLDNVALLPEEGENSITPAEVRLAVA